MKKTFLVMFLLLIGFAALFAEEGPTVTLVNNTGKTIKTVILKYSYSSNGITSNSTSRITFNPDFSTGRTTTAKLSDPLSVANRFDVELEYTDGTTNKLGMMTVSSNNLRMEFSPSSSTASAANTARSGAVALKLGEGRTVSFRGSESLWYSVDISQNNANFVVQTSGSMDSLLTLYNSSGERIDSDDDSGDSLNARISRTLNSGKYYIEVKNYNQKAEQCVLTASSSGGSSGTVASGSASSGSSSSGSSSASSSPVSNMIFCLVCNGTGQQQCYGCFGTGRFMNQTCTLCWGSGTKGFCTTCSGMGYIVVAPPTTTYVPPPSTTYIPPATTYSSPSYSSGSSGVSPVGSRTCPVCDGIGQTRDYSNNTPGLSLYCRICGGTYPDHRHSYCTTCRGTGRIDTY